MNFEVYVVMETCCPQEVACDRSDLNPAGRRRASKNNVGKNKEEECCHFYLGMSAAAALVVI